MPAPSYRRHIRLFSSAANTPLSVGLLSDTNANVYIGASPHNISEDFSGLMDEVRIYNRTLTETEIKALAENVLVDSGAEWRYSETEQAGWTEISFDDSQWNIGITPFDDHSVTGWCAFGGNGTNWPLYTSFYLRKNIDVKQQGDLTLRIAIDNDFVLYFDGNEVAAINSEGCPYKWQHEYNIPSVNIGTHTIAVKITDRGDDNGFDMMVSGQVTPSQTCTYTYSDWGECQPNNTQTRTMLTATPEGCVGTPELSRSCDYVPPVLRLNIFSPDIKPEQKIRVINNLKFAFLDVVTDERINEIAGSGRFAGDSCYLGTVIATSSILARDIATSIIRDIATDVALAPISNITTGSKLGDIFLHLASYSVAAIIKGTPADEAILKYVTENTVGYILGRAVGDYYRLIDPKKSTSTKLIEDVFKTDGVQAWSGLGNNVGNRWQQQTGAPITYIKFQAYYNPYTHFTTAIVNATCNNDTGGQIKKNYFFIYELQKNGMWDVSRIDGSLKILSFP